MAIVLNEADVRAVLPMTDLISTMETALTRFSAGEVLQPLRTVLQIQTHTLEQSTKHQAPATKHQAPGTTDQVPRTKDQGPAFFALMPAHQPDPPALGAKLVTVFNANAARGLPTHLATIILLDPETGALAALMDGRYITEARTAAVSAVSVRHMARADARVLAILGSGVQARSHLEALAIVRPPSEVRVWSRTAAHREAFARDMSALVAAPITAVGSARDAVAGADLIVLATSSPSPVVENAWVADGVHICAVGACRPDVREMDGALVGRARLVVDSRTGALAEAGDIVIPIREGRFAADHIAGELGEVAGGRAAGRTSPREVTIFKSLGMAVEDVAAAELVWRRAAERGIGRAIVL